MVRFMLQQLSLVVLFKVGFSQSLVEAVTAAAQQVPPYRGLSLP